MLGRFFILFTLSSFLFLGLTTIVQAVNSPAFPSCPNPGGELKADYNEGNHGIPGKLGDQTGSDSVYTIGENNVQCFCSTDNQGTQTNWWKISSLTQSEIDQLKNSGWIYVANGAVWGLEETPYMAFNSNYACGSAIGGSGEVQGTSTQESGQVLGAAILPATGSWGILVILGLGLFLLLVGTRMKLREKSA